LLPNTDCRDVILMGIDGRAATAGIDLVHSQTGMARGLEMPHVQIPRALIQPARAMAPLLRLPRR